jgi:hypothetical protein
MNEPDVDERPTKKYESANQRFNPRAFPALSSSSPRRSWFSRSPNVPFATFCDRMFREMSALDETGGRIGIFHAADLYVRLAVKNYLLRTWVGLESPVNRC